MDQILLLIPIWNFVVTVNYIDSALRLLQFLCLAWFSSLRVYALLDGKYIMAGIVLLLNLVPFGTNMVSAANTVVVEDSVVCTSVSRISDNVILSYLQNNIYGIYTQDLIVSLFTRVSVIIGDVIVLAVTWTKTARAYREARQLHIRSPLATVLFRDGTTHEPNLPLTLHFLILLLVMNILEVIQENIVSLVTDSLTRYICSFPPMIVCHFILSLRQIEPAGSSWASGNPSRSLRFVGNMGQSLQFGEEGVDEEAEASGVEAAFDEAKFSPESAARVSGGEKANEELRHRSVIDLEAQQGPSTYVQV
ncbi:hypothetical protein BC629DRAFT_1533270 [Irpex lacteus]|nr:hypothetical protein BC629DRAFT_1533270 [Irpex lacteus]